jgi:hypothetical protein
MPTAFAPVWGCRRQRGSGGDQILDPGWSDQLFIALCRRYGISRFDIAGCTGKPLSSKHPRSFIEQVLWPEFRELSSALSAYLAEITEKLICEGVHGAKVREVTMLNLTPGLMSLLTAGGGPMQATR